MLKNFFVSIVTSFGLAACGGKVTPQQPSEVASPSAVELGEITVFEGDQPMLKIHADGSTEIGGHAGKMELKPDQTVSSDSLPVVWQPGPTIKADGTFEGKGEGGIRVTADGKIVDLKTNEPIPVTVTADSAAVVEGGKTVTIGLGSDGKVAVTGGNTKPDKELRVEGATTPGKRRTVLVLMALMMGGVTHSEVSPGVSIPAAHS